MSINKLFDYYAFRVLLVNGFWLLLSFFSLPFLLMMQCAMLLAIVMNWYNEDNDTYYPDCCEHGRWTRRAPGSIGYMVDAN